MESGLLHRMVWPFMPQLLLALIVAGQAELTWTAGYVPRWFAVQKMVNHSSINWAQRNDFVNWDQYAAIKPNRHFSRQ